MGYFRKNIDMMSGYVPGEQPNFSVVKLNTNENPYPPSPRVFEKMKSLTGEQLRCYPSPSSEQLRKTIAKFFGLNCDNVIVGNGSDDILTIIMRSFVGEQEGCAFFYPSYSLYKTLAQIQGAKEISYPLGIDFSYPSDLPKEFKGAKVLFITRPNAPTGNSCCKDWVRKVARNFGGILVIDEAYADFADDNCLEMVKQFDNVVVTRTLSKSYSLAGLRVGFALAPKNLISGMIKVRDSYNVNSFSQMVAQEALQDQKYFSQCVAKIKQSRQALSKKLAVLGFRALSSQANFLLICPPEPFSAESIFYELKKRNIYVRYFCEPNINQYFRVTIATERENSLLLQALEEIIR